MSKQKNRFVWPWLVGIGLAVCFVIYPLLHKGFFISDDGEWMIIRLTAFYQSLAEGQFPVRFLGRLNHSFGYPVANFLYPGFLYLGSGLHFLGLSYVLAVKVILGGSIFLATYLVFFWLRVYFSSFASFYGSLAFLYSPYLIFDLYKRGSVGEIFVLPAVALGFWCVAIGSRWLFPLAIAWLILGHNSLGLLFTLILGAYFVWQKKGEFFLPWLIGIGLPIFFWFPALYEQRFVILDYLRISNPADYFRQSYALFFLGLANLIVFLLAIFQKKKANNPDKLFFVWLFLLSTFFATSLAQQFWQTKLLEKVMQFPYRFLAVGLFTAAWLTAYLVNLLTTRKRVILISFLILMWFTVSFSVLQKINYIDWPEGYYSTNEATTTVADEYLPRWAIDRPRERFSQKLIIFQGQGKIIDHQYAHQKIKAKVQLETGSILQVNTIYYPGWGALVDSTPVKINYQNSYGLMRLLVPAGVHDIQLEFRETPLRLLSDALSLLFIVSYFIYLIRQWRQSKAA